MKVIVDVREPYEYQTGHVEGALNVPLSQISTGSEELNNLPKDTEIIVYCRSGARSEAAIERLQQLGFSNIINGINQEQVELKN